VGQRRVVVSGLGVVSAVGSGAAFWQGLLAGRSGFRREPGASAAAVARVTDTVGADSLRNKRRARILNRSSELLIAAAALARSDAALADDGLAGGRLGTAIGVGPIDQHTPDFQQAIANAPSEQGRLGATWIAAVGSGLDPLRRLRHLPNVVTSLVSIEHAADGPSLTFVGGALAGMAALAEAYALIRAGTVDAVLCGGVDARLHRQAMAALTRSLTLSGAIDPDDACHPFHEAMTGTAVAEGAAVLVLEELASATQRGCRCYAELVDTRSFGPGDPGRWVELFHYRPLVAGESQVAIVAHGDGGPLDRPEAAAIRASFPQQERLCVTSIKGGVGHTMTACGPLNAAVACLAIRDGVVPPIAGFRRPSAELPLVEGAPARAPIDEAIAVSLDRSGAGTSLWFNRVA